MALVHHHHQPINVTRKTPQKTKPHKAPSHNISSCTSLVLPHHHYKLIIDTYSTNMSSSTTILLKGGRVVNADEEFLADVLIENDKIVQISPNITPADNVRMIDCTGKLIIPGGIDPHTHCELPFMGQVAVDDFEYGTKAAVAGGTTMLIDFAIPQAGENLLKTYQTW